ncbi:DUF4396 domain-containing protein [Salinisphaera sp. T31B1]|uniref:DUF4396 domain-containing protein n=1 Tax=Salinisphaera sp. T31B1 TaxID=727963 RepID=UPI003341FC01
MSIALIAWVSIGLGVATAAAIALDVRAHPQPMGIMNITWPITGLYFPVVGWWLYVAMGRPDAMASHGSHDSGTNEGGGNHGHHHASKPKWQSVFVGVTHCGGGCTLGDSVAAPIVAAIGLTVFGSELIGHFVGAFIGAYLFGLLFQIVPTMQMGESSLGRAFVNAVKADTLSLIAFEIGMFGWLAIAFKLILPEMPAVATPVYWFMMQIAMMIGFATAYPANWWLIDRGIKHGM